jgi:hypothetical protein
VVATEVGEEKKGGGTYVIRDSSTEIGGGEARNLMRPNTRLDQPQKDDISTKKGV